ncbi:MAG: hypothetical protein KF850_18560 [Labilithrix sp.]|nr:hypothetical protein [Labilithrix sp.]
MRTSLRGALAFSVFTTVFIAAGCGEGPSPDGEAGPGDAPDRVTTIGPGGGVVTASDGATIEIPEGALDREVAISITRLDAAPLFALGAGYRMAPDGQTFLKPVILTFPFTAPPADRTEPIVIVSTPTGKEEWESLGGTLVDATHVRAATTHFSDAAATFSPVAWLGSACAIGVLAAGGFDPKDPMFASLAPLDVQRVCSGGSRASNSAECRYNCDRCQSSAWLGGFPALLAEYSSWSSATNNLGGKGKQTADAMAGFVEKLIEMYKGWCIPYRRANPVPGWSAKAWCDAPTNMASFFGKTAEVANYAGIAIACLEALVDAGRQVARAIGITGRDYGYLNDAWYESLSLVACSVVNAANTCAGLATSPGTGGTKAGYSGLIDFVGGNPVFNAAVLGCGTAVACRNEALCEITEKACAYYDQVAVKPLPGFTPETGYEKDNVCCCRSNAADATKPSSWSLTEEHRCLDTGKVFHPGTCGGRTTEARSEAGLPTNADECAERAKGPTPTITGNAWGTMTCRHKVTGANCITYTIGHCADQSAYGAACSEGGIGGAPPVMGPRECSQDESSTTYRCLHSWCAYGCIPGNSPPGSHDDDWEPVYTCTDNPACD